MINREIFCPICDSPAEFFMSTFDFRLQSSKEKYSINKCTTCGHGFLTDLPANIEEQYTENFYTKINSISISNIIQKINRYFLLKRRILQFSDQKEIQIIDIGAGDGSFVRDMRTFGMNVYGVEPSKDGRKAALDYYKVELKKTIKDLRVDSDKSIFINLSHVLEHIQDLDNFLSELKTINKSFKLVMEVPNFSSWESRIFKDKYVHLDLPRHIHHFTNRSLDILMHKHNFNKICEEYSIIQFPLSGYVSLKNSFNFPPYNSNNFIKFLSFLFIPVIGISSLVINSFSKNKTCIGRTYSIE